MTWLKDILLTLVIKIKSWEAFSLLLICVSGYIYLEYYRAKTERIVAVASISNKPQAEKINWVSNKSTEAGVGIIKENNPQIKGAKQ